MSPVPVQSQQAAVLHGPKDLRMEDRPVWPPRHNEAQVQVMQTGLCGSDLHYYLHGRNGDFTLQHSLVLGHEAAGIITALGPAAAAAHPHLRLGQRVAIEAGIMCRTCDYCREGRYNLCKDMRFCSSAKTHPHLDGTLQERMNHPAHVLHPLPDSCSFDQASLAEPLSVLLHAARRAGLAPESMFAAPSPLPPSPPLSPPPLLSALPPTPAPAPSPRPSPKTVLVYGVGAIGMLACALAKALGAARVCAVDINQARLDFALAKGWADAVFLLPTGAPAPTPAPPSKEPNGVPVNGAATNGVAANGTVEPKADAKEKPADTDPLAPARQTAALTLTTFAASEGFDLIFECTGAPPCIQQSVFAARVGGTVMLVGMGTRALLFPLAQAATREVDILGSFRYANTYPAALRLLASAALPNIEQLVTHRYPLERAREAFDVLARGVDGAGRMVVKVMVGPAQG